MSVIIIIGGDHARQAIGDLETESLNRCDEWRTRAENLLKQFRSDASAMCSEE